MSEMYCTKCGCQNFKYQCVNCADTNPSVEMTNSEIKCEELRKLFEDHYWDTFESDKMIILKHIDFVLGLYKTRTPEPTKAEGNELYQLGYEAGRLYEQQLNRAVNALAKLSERNKPTKAELEKMEEDVSIYGATYQKDGKRIDPKDIFTNIPTKADECDHKNKLITDMSTDYWCSDCGALKITNVELSLPKAIPTKAENGLDSFEFRVFLIQFIEALKGKDLDNKDEMRVLVSKWRDNAICKFSAPSITKEKLLAILPEEIPPTSDWYMGYMSYRQVLLQRIEELFKQ